MALRKLIQAHPERYWFSDFRGYAVEHDLGGDRFSISAAADIEARKKRGELVASVLHANCQLILNLFTVQGQSVQIEHSNHQFNAILGTPVQSVAHTLANVWFTSNGDTAEIWAMDTKRHIGMQAYRRQIEGVWGELVREEWRRRMAFPTQFLTPRLSIPPLLAACMESTKGLKLVARILLQARHATKATIPNEILEGLRHLAES